MGHGQRIQLFMQNPEPHWIWRLSCTFDTLEKAWNLVYTGELGHAATVWVAPDDPLPARLCLLAVRIEKVRTEPTYTGRPIDTDP